MRRASRIGGKFARATRLCAGVVTIALSACSERNVQVTNPFDDGGPQPIQQGFFRAGNVEGLSFVSGGESGITDENGAYTCETDKPVSFSIGSVELGETLCATLAHPAALSESGTLFDPRAINIMRLLLVLDTDESFANGIRVSEDIRMLAASWRPVDFLADDFDSELTQIRSDIASVEDRVVAALPSASDAFAILDSSVACAYSGVYVNSVPAGPFNAVTNVALTVYNDPQTQAHIAEFLILRNHSESQMFKQSMTDVQIRTLPTYSGQGVTGEFISPDRVSGSYVNAITQQVVDRNGSFIVFRAGDTGGDYRFAGSFERLGGITGITTLRGRVALTLDGDTIRGEAFDVLLGDGHGVSGFRIPGTDNIEFEVEGLAGTATARLLLDDRGEPIGLEGTWPGFEEYVLQAVGCRLH